jgi:hypothetical protein
MLSGDGSEYLIRATSNGSVKLFYDNAKKLETTSTGVDVTGTVTADGLTVDGNATLQNAVPTLTLSDTDGTNQYLRFRHNGNESYIDSRNNTGHGNLFLGRTDGTSNLPAIKISSGGDVSLYADDGSTQGFFWDASTQRLGIGTTSPVKALHVDGGTSSIAARFSYSGSISYIQFQNDTLNNGYLGYDNAGNLELWAGGSEQVTIASNGNTTINGWIKPELIQHMYDPTGATNTPAGYASAASSAWTLSFVNNDANYPGSYGTILSMIDSNNNYGYSWQLFKGPSTENLYLRTGGSNAWSGWRKLWHEGNDGSGSGLDADTLDGVQGASYLRSDQNDSTTGRLSVDYGTGATAVNLSEAHTIYAFGILNRSGGSRLNFSGNSNYTSLQASSSTSAAEDISLNPFGGNVGIGTTSPSAPLHVVGADSGITISSAAVNRPHLKLVNGSTEVLRLSVNGTYGAIGDSTDGNRYMAFNAGNVGVGTTTPTAKFTVNGAVVAATQTTTKSGTPSPNFDNYQNFIWTITSNITLLNPTTEKVGQTGFFIFIHSGAGRTVSLGTDYETVGGAGLTLSSTNGAADLVPYAVLSTGRILLGTPQLAFA